MMSSCLLHSPDKWQEGKSYSISEAGATEGKVVHVTVDKVLVRPWGVSWSASKQSGILVAPTTRGIVVKLLLCVGGVL